MADPAPDAAILKEIGEALRALDTLHAELRPLVARLPDSIPPAKAKTGAVKVHNWLKRHSAMGKIAGSRLFDTLNPATQDGLRWLDDVVAELMKTEDALRRASKVALLDFAKEPDVVVKKIRALAKEGDNPPWVATTLARIENDSMPDQSKKERTEALVKVMQKGQEIGGIVGTSISSLALLVILHAIWKMIGKKLTGKPKV